MDPLPPPSACPGIDDSAVWEWSHLLDFPIDAIDDVIIQPSSPPPLAPGAAAAGGRVRKRDARLLCDNFLAGRVPCACPELDEAAEEEEATVMGMKEKKRARRGGGGASGPGRCQVPGCDADISELKGYHRRHRVCLRCANAVSVDLEGTAQRYCQQCGKFHLLTDFDEGKRSCRRKLERHNKRRRRRPTDNNMAEKDKELEGKANLDSVHGEPSKDSTDRASFESDSLCIEDKPRDAEGLMDMEGHGSPYCLDPINHATGHSNNIGSCALSNDTQIEERTDQPKSSISSFYGNRNTYSTVCPTGRISFKLYDWNPAEFPRRLRLQVFQWLASMPVELEGYIRPGCTILTIFIAMPQMMWNRLSNDTAHYLHQFLKEPDNMLYGRGSIHVYLNNILYQVLRDGTSLSNVKMEVQVPRLHYVHPLFFEAGKAMEFIICGSNLLQPKFRFLVSFAGKYLTGGTCHEISHEKTRTGHDTEGLSEQYLEHQILRINFSHLEIEAFGPAFIEVENECGLSNFIPVLFADKSICSDLQTLQQLYDLDQTAPEDRQRALVSGLCEAHVSRQSKISELLLDIGWLLRVPQMEENKALLSPLNIQRMCNLINYLIQTNSSNILRKVVHSLNSQLEAFNSQQKLKIPNESCTAYIKLKKSMDMAKVTLKKKLQSGSANRTDSENSVLQQDDRFHDFHLDPVPSVSDHVPEDDEVVIPSKQNKYLLPACKDESHPLLAECSLLQAGSTSSHLQNRLPLKSRDSSRKAMSPRLVILVMASVFVCCGICAALLHPHMAGRMMVSARRCISRNP